MEYDFTEGGKKTFKAFGGNAIGGTPNAVVRNQSDQDIWKSIQEMGGDTGKMSSWLTNQKYSPDQIKSALGSNGVDLAAAEKFVMDDPNLRNWATNYKAPTAQTTSVSSSSKPNDAQIKQFVTANGGSPGVIQAAMKQFGVGFDDIKRAGGWDDNQVNDYVAKSGDASLQGDLGRYRSGRGTNIIDSVQQAMQAGGVTGNGMPTSSTYTPARFNGGSIRQSQTMEGIISRLVGDTSTPWMQRAQALATEKMADRGLQSSSIAAGAGAQAAIDAAGDIARTDSGYHTSMALQNASQRNDMARTNAQLQSQNDQFNAKASNDFTMQDRDFAYDVGRGTIEQGFTRDNLELKAQIDRDTNLQLAQLDADSRARLATLSNELGETTTGRAALVNLTSKYTNLVNNLRNDPDLDAGTKEKSIEDLATDWREEGNRIALIYNVTLPPDYFPG